MNIPRRSSLIFGSVKTGKLISANFFCPSLLGVQATRIQEYAGGAWRKKNGLPIQPNSHGPLTDGPDYSFLDGRPTPVGYGKIKRALVQKDLASKIMEFSSEMDFAVAHHEDTLRQADAYNESILSKKLKPKGKMPPEVRSRS